MVATLQQGELWWAELGGPVGSAAAGRRPVVVVQGNAFNRSAIATVVVVPLTSNLLRAQAPGNVRLTMAETGLPRESVANVSLVAAVDKAQLQQRIGRLQQPQLAAVLDGVGLVMGR